MASRSLLLVTYIILSCCGVLLTDILPNEEDSVCSITIFGEIPQQLHFEGDIVVPFKKSFSDVLTSYCEENLCPSLGKNPQFTSENVNTVEIQFMPNHADYSFYVEQPISGDRVPTTLLEDTLINYNDKIFQAIKFQFDVISDGFPNVATDETSSFEMTSEATSIVQTSESISTTAEITSLSIPTVQSTVETTFLSTSAVQSTAETTSLSTPTTQSTAETTSLSTPTVQSTAETTSLSTPTAQSTAETSVLTEQSTLETSVLTEQSTSAITMTGTTIAVTEQETTELNASEGPSLDDWEVALIVIGCLAGVTLAGGLTYYLTKKRHSPFDRLRGYSDLGEDDDERIIGEDGSRSLKFHNAAFVEEAHFDMNSVFNQNNSLEQ